MSAFTAPTVVKVRHELNKELILDVTGPTSYDTGGSIVDLSVSSLGASAMVKVYAIDLVGVGASTVKHTMVPVVGASNSPSLWKLMVFDAAVADGGDEVANTTNLSGNTYRIQVSGE